jgi:hypothetical protein
MRVDLIAGMGLLLISAGCGTSEVTTDSNPGLGGSGGHSGDASVDGASASAGAAGTGGSTGGSGGDSGAAGSSGAGGSGGTSGSDGGTGGSGGGSGGTGGTGGSGGGSGGTAGSGGTGGTIGQPCATDNECASGTTCQVLPNASQTALELKCAPLVGPSGTGASCTQPSDCRSGLCIQGKCSAPCATPLDCTQAGTCRTETVTVGALSGSFDLCVVAPCGNTAACDPGEVCSQLQSEGGNLVAYCRQANAGGAALGTACAADGACASLSCPTWLGFCTEVCSGSADCIAASPQACVDIFNNGSSVVAGCAPSCQRTADCPTGNACMIATDSASNLHRFICGPGWGSDPVGTSCQGTNECASGLCLQNYTNGQLVDAICTAPCTTGADCPTGYQVCADVQMTTPSGSGTQTIRMCNHP